MGLEVTQSIQSMEMTSPSVTSSQNNQIPLIAKKQTVVRAYFDILPITNSALKCSIGGVLKGTTQNGTQLGPEPAKNFAQLDSDKNGKMQIKREGLGAGGAGLYFVLPPSWVEAGSLTLTVQIKNSSGTLVDCSKCASAPSVTFVAPSPLWLRLIRIQEIADPSLAVLSSPTELDVQLTKSWLKRALPIQNLGPEADTYLGGDNETRQLDPGAVITICDNVTSKVYFYRLEAGNADLHDHTRLVGLFKYNPARPVSGCGNSHGVVNADVPVAVPAGSQIPSDWPSFTSPSWDQDGSYADWYTGHELAHSFGFRHLGKDGVGYCDAPKSDGDVILYDADPFDNDGRISDAQGTYFGFDVGHIWTPIQGANAAWLTMKPLPSNLPDPDGWYDIRTWCSRRWISPAVYKMIKEILDEENNPSPSTPQELRVSRLMPTGVSSLNHRDGLPRAVVFSIVTRMEESNDLLLYAEAPRDRNSPTRPKLSRVSFQEGDFLGVVAMVNLTKQTGVFQLTSRVHRAEVQPTVEHPDATLKLYAKNADGTEQVLVEKNVSVRISSYKEKTGFIYDAIQIPQLPSGTFFTALKLFLIGKQEPVAVMPISQVPPRVQKLTALFKPETGAIVLSWTATDDDSDIKFVTFVVQIRFDKGKTWKILDEGRSATRMIIAKEQIEKLRLKDSASACIKIIANDGFNKSESGVLVPLTKGDNVPNCN